MRGHIRKYQGKRKETWQIVLSLGRDPATGKYRQKRITVEGTKRDAERKMAELLHKMDTGSYVDPGKVTLAEYLDRWLEGRRASIAPRTFESYSMIAEKHIKPALGHVLLSRLQPVHLHDYYTRALNEGRADNRKAAGRSLSSTTVLRHHRLLHAALKQAVKWGLVARNVAEAVDAPRAARGEAKTLEPAQVRVLLQALEGHYLYMPVYLAIMTGMRAGEILGLQWKDVDLRAGTITVSRALQGTRKAGLAFRQPKTAGSRRRIEIGEAVVRALREHKVQQAKERLAFGQGYQNLDLVCCLQDGSPIVPGTLSSRFHDLSRTLALEVRFHDLRHTHATLMLRQGEHPKIISERLGHSNIGITMNLYSHVVPGMQRGAADRLERLVFEDKGAAAGGKS